MSLIVKIGADIRSFNREMRRLTSDVSSVSNQLSSTGKTLTTAFTVPLAAVATASVKVGMDFEAAMSEVKAASGATGTELQDLEAIAKELGASTKYSAVETAQGLTELLKAGQSTKEAMASIPGVLSLASAGAIEVADAAAITTSALAQFSLGADQAGRISDVLAKTANSTKTDVDELGQALITAGPAGASAGMSFEEVNAILGIFANKGVTGALAGEKLKQVIGRLSTPTKQTSKTLDALGVSVYDSKGNMRSMIDIIGDLDKSTEGLTQEQRNAALSTIFGADAIAAANTLLDEGADSISKFSKELGDSSGYADEFAATLNDNMKGRLEAMMGDLENVGLIIFDALQPALEALIASVSKVAEWFSNLSPTTQKFIMAIAALLAAIGPLLVVIATLVRAFGIVKAAIMAVQVATWGAIGIWVAVGVAIAALVILIVMYWDEICTYTAEAWDSIKAYFSELWKSISETATAIWDSIATYFVDLWNSIKETASSIWNSITTFFSDTWNSIKETSTNIWNGIKEFLLGLWTSIVEMVTPIFQTIGNFISAVWNGIMMVVQAVWGFIWQYLVAIWTAILYFATPVFQALADFFVALWEGIKNVAITVWTAVSEFLLSVWNGIKIIATTVWNAIASFFTTLWNGIKNVAITVWNSVKSFLTGLWNGIKSTASSVWNAIKSAIEGPVNNAKSKVTSVFNSLKSTVSGIWNSIKSTASSVWEGIKGTITGIVDGISSSVSGAFEGMKSAVLGVWEGIKSGIKVVINGIIKIINNFIDGFNTPAKLLNKVPGVDAPTIPHIPMLATGGTLFGNGQAIVGEAGPELVSKSGSSVKVTPLSAGEKARGISGALGGRGVNINVSQLVVREEADIRRIAQELNRIQERTSRASGNLQL